MEVENQKFRFPRLSNTTSVNAVAFLSNSQQDEQKKLLQKLKICKLNPQSKEQKPHLKAKILIMNIIWTNQMIKQKYNIWQNQ